MKEEQLYKPIEEFFLSLDYEVSAEVKDVDIVVIKEEQLIAIEMKTSLNFKLLYQGIERQTYIDNVYLAIPKTDAKLTEKSSYVEKLKILRRLGLGLILVDFTKKEPLILIALEPHTYNHKQTKAKNAHKKVSLIKELNSRSGSYNKGGTAGKIITFYKEQTLKIAKYLSDNQIHKLSDIKENTGIDKASTILNKNYYEWFDNTSRGYYKLSKKGQDALIQFSYIVEKL